ncbi:hypothetical protein [Halovivax limisalsi]|uniref:hypothetical protein n=1 Tax=Halovivax limisalsi TaxID=1453760 RepID=UPI001FFCAFDD|nr:hypothetical protein [Halovivax limisalsi]
MDDTPEAGQNTSSTRRARDLLTDEHAETIETIDACAERAAATWAEPVPTDRDAVVEPFRARLEDRGVLAELPAVIESVVEPLDQELQATPVAGPPYVVVTSRGVLLRATLDTDRLVVGIEPFAVTAGPGAGYRLRDAIRVTVSLA